MGQNKLAVLTGDHINEGFFLQENVWPFCWAEKKSGRITEVAVRRGFTERPMFLFSGLIGL